MKLHELFENKNSIPTDMIITYKENKMVYHTTGDKAAKKIKKDGFLTGHEMSFSEKRKAIYFADKNVNPDLYARTGEDEANEGQKPAYIGVNLKGLRLLNLSYEEEGKLVNYKKYNNLVVRGELDKIPHKIDGSISFLDDGAVYEVALFKNVANKLV